MLVSFGLSLVDVFSSNLLRLACFGLFYFHLGETSSWIKADKLKFDS